MHRNGRSKSRRGSLVNAFVPVACLVLALAPGLALSPGSATADDDDWVKDGKGGDVHMELKARPNQDPISAIPVHVHRSTADVPAFPLNRPRLADPNQWPATITIAGVKLERRIHAWDGPIGMNLTSLRQVRRGMRVVLSYHRPGADESAGWGPRFTWNERGRLVERMWYEPNAKRLVTHDYTYYPGGRLLGYSYRSGPRNVDDDEADTEYLSEFFDKSGKLIAVGYEKKRNDQVASMYLWNGEAVPFDDFRMKSHVLYARAQ